MTRTALISAAAQAGRIEPTGKITATVKPAAGPHPAARGPSLAAGERETAQFCAPGDNLGFASETNKAFVTDCVRNIEGLVSDRELKETWGLNDQQWTSLADNAALLDAIKAERGRRIRSGEAAREAAQRHFATAPTILNTILQNDAISPRHRIEAAKELRQVATSSADAQGATGEKFVISIDLGEDCRLVQEFELPARVRYDDGDAQ